MFILGTQMLPAIVIIIPLNQLLQKYKMIDTIWGLILPYTGLLLPTVIWIMYGYFLILPKEIEEAALIAGASRLKSFAASSSTAVFPRFIASVDSLWWKINEEQI